MVSNKSRPRRAVCCRIKRNCLAFLRLPRSCAHRSEFRLARKLRGVLWLEHEENGEQREGTGVVVRRQSDGVAGLRIDPGDYRLRRVPQGSFLFAGAFWAIDPRRGFSVRPPVTEGGCFLCSLGKLLGQIIDTA